MNKLEKRWGARVGEDKWLNYNNEPHPFNVCHKDFYCRQHPEFEMILYTMSRQWYKNESKDRAHPNWVKVGI